MELIEKLLVEGFIGAGIATLGFAILFNVRGSKLWLAGIAGGVGGLVYLWAKQVFKEEAFSNLLASIALSIVSEIFARWQKTTVTTFAVSGLIPLVPGGTSYEMMVAFQESNLTLGLSKAVSLMSIALMLALGVILVSNFTRFFLYSKRKIEKGARRLIEEEPTN